nr:hypothetical protein [Tanacetum cinerariifolium]
MLTNKCRTSFAKPEFLKKGQRANPRLYDIGCYNDNLDLMLAPESDEVILLEKESRSKLSDLIRPFDYTKINNLYDLFVPQREKSSEQRYFLERSRLSDTSLNNENSKESFSKQTTLLEKWMDESIPWDKTCKSSIEIFKVKTYVNTIFNGVELCKEKIASRTYSGYLDPFIQNTIEANFSPEISIINAGLEQFHKCLNEEMEYYYADHMNAILGVYTELDEVTNLQCDYLELLEKCKCLEIELSKSKMMSKSFESVQKHATNLELELQQCKEKIKNDKFFKVNQTKDFCKEREQYFEIQDLKAQLQDKRHCNNQRPSVLGKLTTFSNSFERKYFSKSKSVTQNNVSVDFSKLVTAQTLPPNKKSILKNMNVLAPGMYKFHTEPNQARTSQLPQDFRKTNKRVSFSTGVILTTSVSRRQLKSNLLGDRVMRNNSQGKKQEVEDQHRNVKLPKNKTSVTACNDSLNAKTLNVNFVCATCDKCVLNDKHDMCVRNKMHKAFTLPVIEFPLAEEVPTSSEESCHCQKKREATGVQIALLLKSRRNCQSKTVTLTSDETGKKKGRIVTLTAKDMQKRKNDVKARTTLLLSLLDEHQLQFSKYKTAQELWAAILKTFDGNETTKKTKKNLLKQQYGNFKAEGSETLEQMFNRLSDLDTMSLDDLYNHLKVYESEVQKKSEQNPQNMAFISSAKHSRENEDVNTASVSTASTNVPTANANIGMASISQDTACSYIASQSSGSQIKFEDINQIDKDDMEESYMANDEKNHALVADEEAPTEFALTAITSAESKVFDNSLCFKDCKKNTDSLNSKITDLTDKLFDAKNMIYHYKLGLAQVESRLVEHKDREIKYCEKIRGLEFKTESSDDYIKILKKELETLKKEKECDVPPPPAQIYSSPKKDMSWTGLPEFKDDTVTDYSRHAPTIESSQDDAQNRNPSVTETKESISTVSPKSFIKFVKANDSPTKSKIDKAEKAKKSPVKYAEQYRKPTQKPNVRGNQRNWNNLKSYQLGLNFEIKKNACFNCGNFNHLAYDYRKRVKNGTSRSQNYTHKSFTSGPVVHKPYRLPMRPMRSNINGVRPNRTSFNKPTHSYTNRPFQRTSAVRSQYRAPWVPTVNRNFPPINRKFPTANRKFPTGSTKFHTADMGKKGKVVKPSAYWFWKPSHNLSNKGPNKNSVSVMFKKYTYIDTQGRLNGYSRHMTGNISYLSDYEPFDGGYVSFGQGGCKITGKGTIKTGKLKFENVYFVKDLKTPRQHNMHSIDLKNIVPHKDLTCLVAKASADECMLWHRRLGGSQLQPPITKTKCAQIESRANKRSIINLIKTQSMYNTCCSP